MNAQSIFGWAVILIALGHSIWQWVRWGRDGSLSRKRLAVGIFAGTLINYISAWFVWVVMAILIIGIDIPLISSQHIDWLFRALLAPGVWFLGLF